MKLGEILSQEDNARPLVGHDVEFWIKKGNTQRFRVKAKMYPLGEADRQQAKRDAVKYLRTLPDYKETERDGSTYLPPIPEMVRLEEEEYKRLCLILHDADDPTSKFVLNADYATFRAGVTIEQVNWLGREYDRYISEEYPELLSEKQRKELEDEARSKS
jgi:hypothetical protein